MEKAYVPVQEKERNKGRVSFDFGTSVPKSSFVDNESSSKMTEDDGSKNPNFTDFLAPKPRLTEPEDTVPCQCSSSSGSWGDEESPDLDGEYIVVGKQRRRMSNAVAALDLDFLSKRRPSYSRKGSSGPAVLNTLTPRTSVQFSYFGNSPLSSESGTASTTGWESTFDQIWPRTSTEQIMTKHTYKTQVSQSILKMDHAFPFLHVTSAGPSWRESMQHGLEQLNNAVEEVWRKPNLSQDLAHGMADHLRSTSNLDMLCRMYIDNKLDLRTEAGKTIENFFSDRNRDYVLHQPWFGEFLSVLLFDDSRDQSSPRDRERYRQSASLLESLIRHGTETCCKIVDAGGLEFLLRACRWEWENGTGEDNWETLRESASALCNLAVLGSRDVRKAMVEKNVPAWMFMLLSHKDLRIRYYACLIVTVIASERELESAVEQSQTLPLVVNFMQNHKPSDMVPLDEKYRTGWPKAWLMEIVSLLSSPRSEVQALACFQLAKEAHIRRSRDSSTQVFEEVGALPALRTIAASPGNPMATTFAEQVLRIVGEELPRKLTQSVPIWTVSDVEFWVAQIGFGEYACQFARYRVDGDLLLRTTDRHLINEIGMTSEYERMRFMRELSSLKRSADYGCVDPTRLDMWLLGLDKSMSLYTYEMLLNGIDRRSLIHVDDSMLKNEGGITNSVHRMKVLNAIKEVKHVDELDIALLRKQVDIFICYRRSTGSQLASLLKVHLQLRGYKVFIDVDRLYAGQFDTSLLKNIRAAKHFILVLTPHALDRCVEDHACKDWVHLEIRTALEFGRNIVPVQDKGFAWPDLNSLPGDIRQIAFFNAIHWVHEYQEACVEKLDRFLKGEHAGVQEGCPTASGGHGSVVLSPSGSRAQSLVDTAPAITKQMSECLSSRSLKRSATHGRLDSA